MGPKVKEQSYFSNEFHWQRKINKQTKKLSNQHFSKVTQSQRQSTERRIHTHGNSICSSNRARSGRSYRRSSSSHCSRACTPMASRAGAHRIACKPFSSRDFTTSNLLINYLLKKTEAIFYGRSAATSRSHEIRDKNTLCVEREKW